MLEGGREVLYGEPRCYRGAATCYMGSRGVIWGLRGVIWEAGVFSVGREVLAYGSRGVIRGP